MRPKYPTLGHSFVIEKKAVDLVKLFLPESSWLWRRQEPDLFVDYLVEKIEHGEPAGLQFGIQIKGSQQAVRRGGIIRHRMERKPLLYYRDAARFPIFVVLADVEQRSAYWIFAQQYLRERAAAARLNSQNSLSVTFDLKDCLSDIKRFIEAVSAAERYMRELYPGSVPAAIEERRHSLQSLDSGVAVEVSVLKGQEIVEVRSKKPISFTFRSQDAEAKERFHTLLTGGDVFQAEMELVGPIASPLFARLMPTGRYRVRFEPERRVGCVQLSWGKARPQFVQINGSWQTGTHRARFDGTLPNTPLSVEIRVERGVQASDTVLRVSTPVDLDRWQGHLVSNPPWFEVVHDLISTLAGQEPVNLTCFIEGLRLVSGVLTASATQANARIAQKLNWIGRARSLAIQYAPTAMLPRLSEITYETERHLDAFWAITRGDSFFDDISGATFDFRIDSRRLPEDWQSCPCKVRGAMKIVGGAAFDLFGHTIEIPGVENVFSSVELISIEQVSSSSKRLTFRGTDGARWSRRKTRGGAHGP